MTFKAIQINNHRTIYSIFPRIDFARKIINIALLFLLPCVSMGATVSSIPNTWEIVIPWTEKGTSFQFVARSSEIVADCRNNPTGYLIFPTIIQAAHIISLDSKVLLRFGDPSFETVRSYYGTPVLSCKQIVNGQVLTWKIVSSTKYFARIREFPHVERNDSWVNFYHETVYIIAAGALIVLSLFCLLVFQGKISRRLNYSLIGSCLVLAVYFMWSVPAFFNIHTDMVTTQKIADTAVWIGLCLFFYCLRQENLIPKYFIPAFSVVVAVSCFLILSGSNGDEMQVGTSLPFMFMVILATTALITTARRILSIKESPKRIFFQFLSLSVFVTTVYNDAAVIEGFINGYMILPIGIVAGLVFFALAVNEHIVKTYQERDYLRHHLEDEVERKTKALEDTLLELRSTQSELIQKEKMASLGTMSAGIAHEINNSLNYVNGSVKPLERLLNELNDNKQSKALKLIDTMKHGLKLTFDIINSLRSYTGMNQSPFSEKPVKEIVEDVMTLLNHKLGKVKVQLDIDDSVTLYTNLVSLQQILMNLMTNAIDAMDGGGTLTIYSHKKQGVTVIGVKDTGTGIPVEIRNKIYDPFFTTKEVGKGTGIGMHIVYTEVEKLNGTLELHSEEGKGTTFIISLPDCSSDEPEQEQDAEVEHA